MMHVDHGHSRIVSARGSEKFKQTIEVPAMLTAWDWAEILYFDTASKESEKTDSETCSSSGCHQDRRVTNSMPSFYIKDLFSNATFPYEFQILDLPLLSPVDCLWMLIFTLLFCKEQILVKMDISISQDMEA